MTNPRPDAAAVIAVRSELLAQLQAAADRGRSTPCWVDPAPFTSELPAERHQAAAACRACPVLVECARFALVNEETHWVWAGVDLTPTRGPGAPVRARALLQEVAW